MIPYMYTQYNVLFQVDLMDICEEFENMYGKTLYEVVEGECSGDYKQTLLSLIKGEFVAKEQTVKINKHLQIPALVYDQSAVFFLFVFTNQTWTVHLNCIKYSVSWKFHTKISLANIKKIHNNKKSILKYCLVYLKSVCEMYIFSLNDIFLQNNSLF